MTIQPSEPTGETLVLFMVRNGGVHTEVAVGGELDHFTAIKLRSALRAAQACGAHTFTIDCHGLTFIDAGGVAVLLELAETASEHGGTVTLVDVGPVPRRVLRLCRVDEVVTFQEGGLQGGSADRDASRIGPGWPVDAPGQPGSSLDAQVD